MPRTPANPFGATRLDEVLCVEARAYNTRQDGTVHLFLAMDAVSRHAHHFDIRPSAGLADYVTFMRQLEGKYPLVQGITLATSLPPLLRKELMATFPLFGEVLCDPKGVATITEEFHMGFAAHMGLRALN